MSESYDVELVRYDAMCLAIAECHRVDEVKEIRDRAVAFQVYAKQALNVEAERQAAKVRIRAERKAGELLKEMRRNGQREAGRRPQIKVGRYDNDSDHGRIGGYAGSGFKVATIS